MLCREHKRETGREEEEEIEGEGEEEEGRIKGGSETEKEGLHNF